MGPKTTSGDAKASGDAVGAALDRLHAAPLDAFVVLRRELATELRKAGETHASRLVATAPKPSRTAWALNQVARRHPELLTAVLEARVTAVAAQESGDPASVRATARAYRDRVADAVHAAGELLGEVGSQLTATQGRRIGATVQALAGAGDADGRARLLGGRLVADVDVDDPFAGLEIGPARGHRAAATPPPRDDLAPRRAARAAAEVAARERIAQREREKKAHELEKARARVRSLETEVSEARASARHAEVAATRAQSEAERARRAADALEQRLDEARQALRALPS
jgi:hypothetical protein